MSSGDLTTILNSFVEIMKGDPARNSSVSWIRRFDCRNFNNTQEYPGIVERILNNNVAVIIVASCADKQVWENQEKDLARAVMFGNTSSITKLYSGENQHGIKELKKGDLVTVRVGLCEREKGNIYYYYVKSLRKVGRKVEDDIMSKISDPLRGIVEKMVTEDEGIIKFQAYSGNILRASFSRENFYFKGLRVKESFISALLQESSLVYLELSHWDSEDMKEDAEVKLYDKEFILKASSVWLKGDQRPREEFDDAIEVPEECITFNEAGSVNETDYGLTACGSIPDSRNFPGKLVCVEQDWGLVAVEEQVYVFYPNAVSLFGLKVEELPLDAIFSPDQVVRIWLEGEKVTSLTYGVSLTASLRKEAISHYCVQKSLSNNIKSLLEDLNRRQSHSDN